MSNAVEDEIVSMKFENTQFQKGAATTLSTLDKLKASLKFSDVGSSGLDNISKNVGRFNMNPLVDSASEVGKAFSSMSVIAISAIATIASRATTAGLGIVNSLSLGPISSGYGEYETQLGSIQTILANTGLEGQKGLDKVNTSLNQLNHYSDQTIYNFSEMARNIGTFTAAGVNLDTSTAAIKGIANLAAVSGSTSDQASTAMYQLSQALSSGKVSLMDWNSVVNAGMGGKVFRDSLMETARVHGVAIDDMVKSEGSFRDTLKNGWLTSDVLTETLNKFTGDLSATQLKSMGYTQEQIKNIIKQGKVAQDAATKVKTITQLMDTLREAVGSGWQRTFSTIFGDFNEARDLFTGVNNVLSGVIGRQAKARNKMLDQWKEMGGRDKLIDALRHSWQALLSILQPIHDAFREIFPATTGKQLFELTRNLKHFMNNLRLSADAQENLKRTFAGFFAVLHIGFTIVSGIAHVLGTLIGLFVGGQGSTLAFTGSIGDMLVALDAFLTRGKFVENFFNLIASALTGILKPIFALRTALIDVFIGLITADPSQIFNGLRDAISSVLGLVDNLSDGFANAFNAISSAMGGFGSIHGLDLAGMFGGSDAGASATKSIDKVKGSLSGIAGVAERVRTAWFNVIDLFSNGASSGAEGVANRVQAAWQGVMDLFARAKNYVQPLTDALSTIGNVVDAAFTKLSGGASIGDAFDGVGAQIVDAIKNALSNMSFDDVAQAISLGVFIQIYRTFKDFSEAITGVADSASGVLTQVSDNLKTMQNQVKATIILEIALALGLLAGAIYLLAQTDPKSLAQALGAVSIMLLELVVAMKLLVSSFSEVEGVTKPGAGQLILAAGGILILSVAVAAMAGAVYLFSKMDMGQMQKGLLGVTESIAVLTAAAVLLSKGGAGANMIGAAAGLLIMSFALVALLGAIKIYDKVDPDTLQSGLLKIGAAIAVLAITMNLMKTGVGGAAAMFIVSAALVVLAGALKTFAAMSKGDITKSMITLAASLGILAGAMYLMSGGLAGAGALLLMAAALSILVPVLVAAGQLSWETIGKGLLVIVGSMLALALAAAAISPVVPVLIGLAAAVALIGAAVFLAGAGVALFAAGLVALATNGQTGMTVFIDVINQFLAALPQMVEAFGATIDAIANLIGDHAPALIAAFSTIIGSMIMAANKNVPKFGQLMSTLIKTGLKVIVSYYSDLANAGLQLLLNLINALDTHVNLIVSAATNLIIHFVQSLSKNGVKLANAGLQALIDFLNGLATAINTHSAELNAAGGNVAKAIIHGITSAIGAAASSVTSAINTMLQKALAAANPIHLGGKILGKVGLGSSANKSGPTGPTGIFAQLVAGADASKTAIDQVNDALDKIKEKIGDNLDDQKDLVDKLGDRVDKLKHAKKQDPKALAAARKALHDANKDLKTAKDEQQAYNHWVKANGKDLRQLANDYDTMTAHIKKATDEQTAIRENAANNFNKLPDIDTGESLSQYMKSLQTQTAKTQKFKDTLAALRAAGLDDTTYNQFLTEGLDAQKVMDGLIAGGGDAITNFEAQNKGLKDLATGIGEAASATLLNGDHLTYDKAVETATQYLNGLQAGLNDETSLQAIQDSMTKLADKMQKKLNKRLKIASPSKVAAESGMWFGAGLVQGIDGMHKSVVASSDNLAVAAMETLQATLSNAGNSLSTDLSMSPVITPVLDLAQLTKDANDISGLLLTNPIVAGVSFDQASNIASGRADAAGDGGVTNGDGGGDTYVDLYQYNTSPNPLDEATIYRNTQSQLSRAREALSTS